MMLDAQQQQRAESMVRHAADMLTAHVRLVDSLGTTLAAGYPEEGEALPKESALINVPIEMDHEPLHLIISEPIDGGIISPRLVRLIVQSMSNDGERHAPVQPDVKQTMILQLLHGSSQDAGEQRRKADILGVDLSVPRAVVLVDAGDYIGGERADEPESRAKRRVLRAQHVISSIVAYFRLPNDAICSYVGEGEVAILKASTDQDLAHWTDGPSADTDGSWTNLAALKRACAGLLQTVKRDTGSSASIAIGRYHPGLEGLSRSYGDARAALDLGRRIHGPDRVHCLDELGTAAFMGVSDLQTKAGLAAHLLSPLRGSRELLETLDVFFDEDCSHANTAQRLAIHRNTLSYRLDKIKSLTGLDPRRFDDAVQIRLAGVLQAI